MIEPDHKPLEMITLRILTAEPHVSVYSSMMSQLDTGITVKCNS